MPNQLVRLSQGEEGEGGGGERKREREFVFPLQYSLGMSPTQMCIYYRSADNWSPSCFKELFDFFDAKRTHNKGYLLDRYA